MPANLVFVDLTCPHCQLHGLVEVESEIDGQGFSKDYRIGDKVDWLIGRRPHDGRSSPDGYVECDSCGKDYFVRLRVVRDRLISVEIDPTRPGYI
jgi:hypothetical protein